MNKEKQDKLWNELSSDQKLYNIKNYRTYCENIEKHNKAGRFPEAMFNKGMIAVLNEVFGSHNLKTLTYKDIENEIGIIEGFEYSKLGKKERAIHQLLLTAKYLNGDWRPDWDNTAEFKYFIDFSNGKLSTSFIYHCRSMDVYFRSAKLARQAIEILGEDTIKLALSTDY